MSDKDNSWFWASTRELAQMMAEQDMEEVNDFIISDFELLTASTEYEKLTRAGPTNTPETDMNWKTQAAAAVAPAVAPDPSVNPDEALAQSLRKNIENGGVLPLDLKFAKSLLRGFDRFESFTDKQRPHVERLSKPADPSKDAPLGDALRKALNEGNVPHYDEGFAQSLLNSFDRFGTFTDKQRPYVEKILAKSTPGATPLPVVSNDARGQYPNTAALFGPDMFASFEAHGVKLVRKNDGSCVWVKFNNVVAGRLPLGSASPALMVTRAGAEFRTDLIAAMDAIEEDPMDAAKEHGKFTGRCSCCSRELTDPVSIQRGIGPICYAKMGG